MTCNTAFVSRDGKSAGTGNVFALGTRLGVLNGTDHDHISSCLKYDNWESRCLKCFKHTPEKFCRGCNWWSRGSLVNIFLVSSSACFRVWTTTTTTNIQNPSIYLRHKYVNSRFYFPACFFIGFETFLASRLNEFLMRIELWSWKRFPRNSSIF